MIESEWEMSTAEMVVMTSIWTPHSNDNDTNNSDRYILTVDLKRRSTTYNIAFYTPLMGKRQKKYFLHILRLSQRCIAK